MADVRTIALFAWVSAFVHLLTVFSSASEIPSTIRSCFLLLTAVAGAVPTIVGASALLFSPGDLDAALDVLLLGRARAGAKAAPAPNDAAAAAAAAEKTQKTKTPAAADDAAAAAGVGEANDDANDEVGGSCTR
jgi:hypothetical protein